MKRIFSLLAFGLAAAALFGCPVYGDSYENRVCASDGSCYVCSGSVYAADNCTALGCNYDSDCPSNAACINGTCTAAISCSASSQCPSGQACGADSYCHANDSTCGGACPTGYQCTFANEAFVCLPTTNPIDSGVTPVEDAGSPDTSAADSGFSGCTSDASCTTAGSRCIDGACVAAADQCSDTTQCDSGEACVQGVCTPTCSASQACPTGYSCDITNGVCTGNPTPCSTTTSCASGTTCVDQHCVSPCGANNSCSNGFACVDGGCIPEQKSNPTCVVEGTKDACVTGSICLHHSCYISCNADAASQCTTTDRFNVCKPVTTSTGTYSVCGSNENLGTECDPTRNQACSNSAQICIDGFCH